MTKINRREFLTLAGTATLGIASNRCSVNGTDSKDITGEHFDPWLEINMKNIAWNVAQVRKRIDNRPIMAVIKCNAYGHGLVGFAKVLEKQNIQQFAVVKVQEAVSLREME